ncbi:MAG TPA: hypothetical protein PL051_04835 [Candidatus Saccharibacteria bacterium]|nr:hypothetical protein [Candidatus Saccharibacteria bacterium]
MNAKLRGILHKLQRALSSKRFFDVIIAFTILQALWYASSFSPWVNDESKHFRTTELFTQQITPFFDSQPESWDKAGQVARSGSYLFYYLMSWPLRGLQTVTSDPSMQLFGLRLLMIVFFVIGLVYYRKVLLRLNDVPSALVHVVLLAFVLTPAAGLLAGMYNYDNLAFALFGFLLLKSVNMLYETRVRADDVAIILITVVVLVLVKWSALALVAPLVVLLAYNLWRQHGKKYISRAMSSFKALRRPLQIALLVGLLIAAILCIERPIQNMIVYGKPNPSCDVVLSHERCMKFADYANYQRTLAAKEASFEPLSLPAYIVRFWVPKMADTSTNLIERGSSSRLDIVAALYLLGAVSSMAILAVGWRRIWQHEGLRFLLGISIVYVALLIVKEYGVYTEYGIPGAIRARYLVPILPIYFTAVLYVLWPLIIRYKALSATIGLIGLLLLAQGGSIVTHLFTAPASVYSSQASRNVNQRLKSLLDPLIYDE